MLKIAIITGSTRKGRLNIQVAEHIQEFSKGLYDDVTFDILDIQDYDLPVYDGEIPPIMLNQKYTDENVQRWSNDVKEYDGYIFVTPEYNKAISAPLKNAIDHIGPEFFDKAAGIVSYGGTLGAVAGANLRLILSNLKLATVAGTTTFSINLDFEDGKFIPQSYHEGTMTVMITDVVRWSTALKTIRNE